MTNPELNYLVVGTWTISKQEPNLLYWEDSNDRYPYIADSVYPGKNIEETARTIVIENLVEEGVDPLRAPKAVIGVRRFGALIFPVEDVMRKAIMVFVQVIPSVLKNLKYSRDLFPARIIRPYSVSNNGYPDDRKVEIAFKKFIKDLT